MKNKSKLTVIFIILAVIVLVDIILAVIFITKKNSGEDSSRDKEDYRLVVVDSYSGAVSLTRKDEEMDVFEEMHLIPKDKCATEANSQITLLVDDDKHIIAKENTVFVINAKGNPKDGKVNIELISGEGLFKIDNKLSEKDEFNVNTPNASLSVRGTEFVVIYNDEEASTFVEVLEGTVWATGAGEELILEAGDTATIFDDRISTYVSDENYESLMDKVNELSQMYEEEMALYEENANYIEDEKIINSLNEANELIQTISGLSQEDISEMYAENLLASIEENITTLNGTSESLNEIAEAAKSKNGWREAYKGVVADPAAWIRGQQLSFSASKVNSYSYSLINLYNDEIPELILYAYGDFSGNGRWNPYVIISYDANRGAFMVVESSIEVNGSIMAIDGKIAFLSISGGTGDWSVYAYDLKEGNMANGKKLAGGTYKDMDSWMEKVGADSIETATYITPNSIVGIIDSYVVNE